MYYPALLILKSYVPIHPEKGMIFFGHIRTLWELKNVVYNTEKFFETHGYPVEPYIIDISTGETLALPHQIGWFDEGEHTDELRDITLEDITFIITESEGIVEIDIEEEGVEIHPLLKEDKVVLRYKTDKNE